MDGIDQEIDPTRGIVKVPEMMIHKGCFSDGINCAVVVCSAGCHMQTQKFLNRLQAMYDISQTDQSLSDQCGAVIVPVVIRGAFANTA